MDPHRVTSFGFPFPSPPQTYKHTPDLKSSLSDPKSGLSDPKQASQTPNKVTQTLNQASQTLNQASPAYTPIVITTPDSGFSDHKSDLPDLN